MFYKRFLSFIALTLLFLPFGTSAAEYLPKSSDDSGNVVVQAEESYRNLYVGGGSVSVAQDVLGDLFVGAGSTQINANIEEDLFVGAGTVSVLNEIGGDARVVGGNIAFTAPINGDVLAAGGTIVMNQGADIGGDLWVAGGVVTLLGDVAGNALITGGELYINGTIEGDVKVWAEDKLVFGPQAEVLGTIVYKGVNPAVIHDGAQVSDIEYSEFDIKEYKFEPLPKDAFKAIWIALAIAKLIMLLAAGLIIWKVLNKLTKETVASGYKNFWANLGVGLLAYILIPMASILLITTGVFFYLGMLGVAICCTLTMLAGIYCVFLLGASIEHWVRRRKTFKVTWTSLLWGVLAGLILAVIPVFGWITICIIFLATFGALLQTLKTRLK